MKISKAQIFKANIPTKLGLGFTITGEVEYVD